MESGKVNVMAAGKADSGKTVALSRVARERYSGDDRERMAEAIRQNGNIWYPLKPGDGHHDE